MSSSKVLKLIYSVRSQDRFFGEQRHGLEKALGELLVCWPCSVSCSERMLIAETEFKVKNLCTYHFDSRPLYECFTSIKVQPEI